MIPHTTATTPVTLDPKAKRHRLAPHFLETFLYRLERDTGLVLRYHTQHKRQRATHGPTMAAGDYRRLMVSLVYLVGDA
jgi:hypothetical protein